MSTDAVVIWGELLWDRFPAARGGDYFGPRGPGEIAGAPRRVRYTRTARDEPLAGRLWQASETLTGVTFPV